MQIVTNQFQKELKKHGNDHFPFLVSHHNLSEYDSNSFMWHCHPEIEITYIKKGAMHYRINNRSFHLKEGEIIFCNSNALHSGEMIDQEDCSYIPVTFDPKLIFFEVPSAQNMWILLSRTCPSVPCISITAENGTKTFVNRC